MRDFAFAMLIGELLGTYSSFAIASPLLAIWKTNEPKWHKLEERYGGAGAAVRIVQQNERGAAHSFAKRGL